ncbi:MAG: hypothetical protein HYY04_16645 [Chloroflexi bacterium]|nr:hypothetical protein [Chloroflexota bacterium]
MSLLDAVIATGSLPPDSVAQAQKKRYSEVLSSHLAVEVGDGLRAVGFPNVKPVRGGPGERAFQGGLGPKKVDVSYADEQHGLMLAVSIKSINFAPFGKNLKNRFADLCTEAITLHMRFPYAVVCALFVFPLAANEDVTPGRTLSTFRRATKLLATISGRQEYTDPGEKFENVTTMLFRPVTGGGLQPEAKLVNCDTQREMSEEEYFLLLRGIYNVRNPHATLGEERDGNLDEA